MRTRHTLVALFACYMCAQLGYSLPVRGVKKATKYIKLVLPKGAKSFDHLLFNYRDIEGNKILMPLFAEHFWTRAPAAKLYMQKLKEGSYPLYNPNVGLGFDGFPVGYLPPKRIAPELLEAVEAYATQKIRNDIRLSFSSTSHFSQHPEDIPYSVEELDHLLANKHFLDYQEDQLKYIVRSRLKVVNPDAHGVEVASLILDTDPIGKSSVGRLNNIILTDQTDHLSAVYLGSGTSDVFNFSSGLKFNENPNYEAMGVFEKKFNKLDEYEQEITQKFIENNKEINELLNNLSKQTLIVVSAGNDAILFAKGVPLSTKSSATGINNNAIIVGSVGIDGKISDFSNFGDQVTVFAPGEFVVTKDIDGKLALVNGTSVAAPQVTAALTDVLALLPDLTADQAKHLLSQTALYHPENARAGILDHYFLLRIAHEISMRLKKYGSLDDHIFDGEVFKDIFPQRRHSILHMSGFYYINTP